MYFKDFTIKRKDFRRKKLTILQHKLKSVMRCYTITNFILEEDNSFFFKKTHKINGIKMIDPKEHEGRIVISDIDDDTISLRIIVAETKKDRDANK